VTTAGLWPALVLALPVIAGGVLHVVVIKLGWWRRLAAMPLDGGLTWRGRRLLGDNKTLRGALVMPAATALSSQTLAMALAALPPSTRSTWMALPVQLASPLWWGALIGLGYIIGELPNSFLKRQLDVAPGAAADGGRLRRALFWVIDQVDFLVGIVVVTAIAGVVIPAGVVAVLLGIALVVHPAVAALMVALGLKRRIG
jgi:hypothetical protein